jgi:hypothetical protein
VKGIREWRMIVKGSRVDRSTSKSYLGAVVTKEGRR